MTEQRVQKKVLDYINKQPQCLAWKVIRANERGVPDIVACIKGHFVGIEVKLSGEHATQIQVCQGERVTGALGSWFEVHSRDEAKAKIEELLCSL